MAVLINHQPRLLIGHRVPAMPGHPNGFSAPNWLPGKNRLDPAYWDAVKGSGLMQAWLDLKYIEVRLDQDVPDPANPPTPEQLAGMPSEQLHEALTDEDVPVEWRPLIREELERRAQENAGAVKPESLEGFKVKDAVALVEAEADPDVLERWAADPRRGVQEAIQRRLAELTSEPEPEPEVTDGGHDA